MTKIMTGTKQTYLLPPFTPVTVFLIAKNAYDFEIFRPSVCVTFCEKLSVIWSSDYPVNSDVTKH